VGGGGGKKIGVRDGMIKGGEVTLGASTRTKIGDIPVSIVCGYDHSKNKSIIKSGEKEGAACRGGWKYQVSGEGSKEKKEKGPASGDLRNTYAPN